MVNNDCVFCTVKAKKENKNIQQRTLSRFITLHFYLLCWALEIDIYVEQEPRNNSQSVLFIIFLYLCGNLNKYVNFSFSLFSCFFFVLSFVFYCTLQDPTLADELGDNLLSTGIEFFTNNCFKEAAEYFTEVIRLVCEFNFIREAYIYQAKCYFELVSSMIYSYS